MEERPVIVTTYLPNGTFRKEAKGFGGSLCKVATKPYLDKIGSFDSKDTAEANDPPKIIVTESEKEIV
jgi:hypothetical protein